MENRKGKHKDGNVRIGIYVEPFKKAVAVYLADITDKTMTDIIWEGIQSIARREGILIDSEDNVSPEHKAAIETTIEIIKTKNQVKG